MMDLSNKMRGCSKEKFRKHVAHGKKEVKISESTIKDMICNNS